MTTDQPELPDDAYIPSVDVCANCGDPYCSGVACFAELNPDKDDDQPAVEDLQDLIRLGRAWKIMETHGLIVAIQALVHAGQRSPASTTVWDEIVAERVRAHAKHGATSMESCDPLADRRLRVLVEEIGEVAAALNDYEHNLARFVDGSYPDMAVRMDLRSELIQVAAMTVAWIAALDGESLPAVSDV